jgi:hypothetical protein
MDDWGVDVMVTGSQKGLMTPPGMGFVFFNDKADGARAHANLVTPYWDWRPRANPEEFYRYFNGTAPTHHLYGLRVALDMILKEEGLENVWHRHAVLARAVWAALEVWGQAGPVRPNIAERSKRSHSVTTANFGPGNGKRMRDWMTNTAGVTLGIPLGGVEGPGGDAEDYLRIGHMGHVNAQMVMGVLGSLQAGHDRAWHPARAHRAGSGGQGHRRRVATLAAVDRKARRVRRRGSCGPVRVPRRAAPRRAAGACGSQSPRLRCRETPYIPTARTGRKHHQYDSERIKNASVHCLNRHRRT